MPPRLEIGHKSNRLFLDGLGCYRGHEHEIHTFGVDRQVDYCIQNYPNVRGIKTMFITGNHDMTHWKTSGVNVGKLISAERKDLIYCGDYQADVVLGGVKIRVVHPDGGGSYALSYRAQKIGEQIPSGEKPQILIFGH